MSNSVIPLLSWRRTSFMTATRQDDQSTARRRVGFRVASICIGLTPFLLFEILLRAVGYGHVSDAVDPFVGFDSAHPLFTLHASGDRYEIPESRQRFFCPESFAANKPEGGFRIFCLGGSTVQGRPYATETAFPKWLELNLECADPDRVWEVVNCGGVSYASYRLAPILREVLDHEPDLLVLYTGHNEFLEDRTYREIKQITPWIAETHRAMTNLRTYNLLRSAWVRANGHHENTPPPDRPILPIDVVAKLDHRDGLDDYHRDAAWRVEIVRHYEFNLRRMVHMADAAGVPVILVNPGSNLRDSPPFKSVHRDDITSAERTRFEELWNQVESPDLPAEERVAILRRCLAIDDRHARTHFELGVSLAGTGQHDLARAAYQRALVEDVCPLRMLPTMHEVIRRVAADTSATLFDARRIFRRLSEHSIPGADWFVDHVHPTIAGHQEIAECLFADLENRGIISPADGWIARRGARYRQQLSRLPRAYFATARMRLDGLRRWSGRAGVGERRSAK